MRLRVCVTFAMLLLIQTSRALLAWKTTSVDLQAEAGASQVVAEYSFTNSGDSAVTLTDITTGCDCTSVEIAKRLFAPNESGAQSHLSSWRSGGQTAEDRHVANGRSCESAISASA